MSKTIFEKLITDISKKDSDTYLRECMSLDPHKVQKAPIRYRLIALAFLKKMTLRELNEKLIESGNETLYSRNFWDASLVFAFTHHFSYDEWRSLLTELTEIAPADQKWFRDKKCTFRELTDYVRSNSKDEDLALLTENRTRLLQNRLEDLTSERAQFFHFMKENIEEFSMVREKVRYYYCKYLYYYMKQKEETYLDAVANGTASAHYSDLMSFMGISDLGRKKFSVDEARSYLENASLSFGGIYDAFNDFYFHYISADWMEIMLEYYGDIEDLPSADKKRLAESLRVYNKDWSGLSDHEVIKRQLEKMEAQDLELDLASKEGQKPSYQVGRSGEKSVRNYIKGTLDIDRTTLICYLLFFNSELHKDDPSYIDQPRLNHILKECHLPLLRDDDPFDGFVISFMESSDPAEELMDSVAFYAFEQKNSFLYRMYNESISNEQEIRKVMGI